MDDRDKDLTGLFVRDLDEIALPPRGAWRRAPGRENTAMRASRYVLTAGAVVAVLAIALLIGFQLRDRGQTAATPSASPTPSASGAAIVNPSASPTGAGPSPSPAASVASGAIYNDDFGFLVVPGDVPVVQIRKESTNARIGQFTSVGFAVSPDGKQIAFWSPDAGAGKLKVFSAAGNGTEQTLVTLTGDQRGGGMVWSGDGAALLYSTETGSFGIGGGTNSATLNVYELAANGRHGTVIDTQTNSGMLYRPIAWDRSANIAAVGLTGEGGFMGFYVTVRFNPDNSVTTSRVDTVSRGMSMGSIRSSTDAKLALGISGGTGDVTWWPIGNYGAAKTEPGAGKRGAMWRPGTHEIGFMSAEQFWLGDVDKAGPQGLCCTAFSGAPANAYIRTFRADGSAVVLVVTPTGPSALGATAEYTLVRLGSDPKAASGDRVTFTESIGLTASVRIR